jgi:exonuclease III
MVGPLLANTIDVLIIAETKLDETFPNSQFEVENDHLWRADRSSHGGGMLLYVRSDLATGR